MNNIEQEIHRIQNNPGMAKVVMGELDETNTNLMDLLQEQ